MKEAEIKANYPLHFLVWQNDFEELEKVLKSEEVSKISSQFANWINRLITKTALFTRFWSGVVLDSDESTAINQP